MENTKNKSQENLKIVAKVDGKAITRGELDFQIQRVARAQQIHPPDTSTEEGKKFEQSILDYIINDILLLKDAKKQGLGAKEEEIDAHYTAILDQLGGEEKLNQVMESMGTTKEQLRDDLSKQITMEKYFKSVKEENEIKVTEEEVQKFYQEKIAPQKPDLDIKKIEPQIRQALEQEKLNQPISEIVQNLKKEADITIIV